MNSGKSRYYAEIIMLFLIAAFIHVVSIRYQRFAANLRNEWAALSKTERTYFNETIWGEDPDLN